MTHAEAIAALIIADHAALTESGKIDRARPWFFSNLHTALRRAERAGFEHGEIVRETMKTTVAGIGYPLPPVKKVTPKIRAEIVEIVNGGHHGFTVELVAPEKRGHTYQIRIVA